MGAIRVSAPGEEIIANNGCRNLTLRIGNYDFPTELNILMNSQGLGHAWFPIS